MNNDRRDFLKYSLGIGLGLLLPKISKSAANNNLYEELGIQKVTILHTNDTHSQVEPLPKNHYSIAAIPCEVFAEMGLQIKAESPFDDAFNIELANGYYGYLPTPRQHELGGYETWRARSSYLEPNASEIITAAIMDLFKQLHPGTASE